MSRVQPIEYKLDLDTGESMEVCELDPETTPPLSDPSVQAALQPVLDQCSFVSREAVEEAKLGSSRKLTSNIRAPFWGSLLMMSRPECAHISSCATADKTKCTTKNVNQSRGKYIGGSFPLCWDFQIHERFSENVRRAAIAIAAVIVHAWREGRNVLIIGERPR